MIAVVSASNSRLTLRAQRVDCFISHSLYHCHCIFNAFPTQPSTEAYTSHTHKKKQTMCARVTTARSVLARHATSQPHLSWVGHHHSHPFNCACEFKGQMKDSTPIALVTHRKEMTACRSTCCCSGLKCDR